ncbi:Permease [Pseudodesulfovibrio profundus]|uniref:Permease n=1 Tax=Pseudodesulfovibrio profundus TaxID=57320 RepID=A0A2C8FDL3_9BACT|nr:DMT family transporter [Pseudodesulfovibrio profundus]SOB60743.1 Permease [Pseudodesulfovibrio profundus]
MSNTHKTGYACALLATLIWSGNFIIARGLGDQISPFTLAALRWGTATLILLPFAGKALWNERATLKKHLPHLLISALIGVTTFNTLIYIAAHTTNTLNLSLIATATPAFVVLLSRVMLGEAITVNKLIGLLAAVFGIVTLVTRGNYQVLLDLSFHQGDIWMLLAALLWAMYSIHLKRRPDTISQKAYLGFTFLAGVLPLIPAAIGEQMVNSSFPLSLTAMGAVLYIGIGASLISYILWAKAMKTIGPTRASFVYYSLPAFCGIEAYLILNEPITWAHAVGFVLILGGILIATHPRFAPAKASVHNS